MKDREDWCAAVHGAKESGTQISNQTTTKKCLLHQPDWKNSCFLGQWLQFSLVHFRRSVASMLCDPMDCSKPGFPVHHHLLELVQTCVRWVGDSIQPSHPLLSPSPPAFNLSQHQSLFQWVSSSHQVAKVLEFQLSISPSNEYSGLISFRINWFDLFAVQETLSSLFEHRSSKGSVLWCSGFFMVQHSHPYMTTGKTVVLTRRTFVGKVVSLLFNSLSRFVIAFLPRSKCLLIAWLQSPSAVILEPKKINSVTIYIVSPSICHEVMGPDDMILVSWMISFKPAFFSLLFHIHQEAL